MNLELVLLGNTFLLFEFLLVSLEQVVYKE